MNTWLKSPSPTPPAPAGDLGSGKIATGAQSERRLIEVLNLLPAYVVLLTPDYHVLFANRFFEERFGRALGRRCYEYLFNRSEPCKICRTFDVLKTRTPVHWEWLGPDGRSYDIHDFLIRDTEGSMLILEVGLDITESKRAEEALAVAASYNRNLIEASLDPLVTIGPDGKISDVNTATEAATGCTRTELIDTDFSDYFTEPHKARAGYLQAFRDGWVRDYPLALRHREGRIIPVLYNASVYRDATGGVVGVFAAARDVTAQRQAEHELRRLNRALLTIDACHQALVRITDETELMREICRVSVTAGGYRLAWVGFAENDPEKSVRPVASAGFEDGYLERAQITWADTERGRGPTGTAIRTGQPAICRHILADPAFAPWRADAAKRGYASSAVLPLLTDGKTFGALNLYAQEPDAFDTAEVELLAGLANDLAYGIRMLRLRAERQGIQDALQRASAYNRSLIEASLDPLVTIGPDGKINDVNAATEAATGCTRTELIGTDFSDYFTEPEKALAGYRQVFRDGLVRDYPLELRRRDGRIVSVLYNASVYRDADGQVAGVFAAARDITELLRAEEVLQHSESSLKEAQRLAHIGNWTLDLVGNVLTWSDEIYRIFEIDPRKFGASYEAFLDAIHPDDREIVNRAYTDSVRNRTPYAVVHRLRMKDGRIKHVHERCETIYDDTGKPLRSFGTVQDITERKRNEAINAARLHLMQHAVTHSLDALLEETLNEAEKITDSLIGFYHFVSPDQQTLSLQNWSTRTKANFCRAEGKGQHYPVAQAGVWVECVHARRPVIHNDYASLPGRKGLPEGHAAVVRELIVPVLRGDEIKAILGVGNKPANYTDEDAEVLSLLADLAWEIAERKRAEEEIRQLNASLEKRVADRTRELEVANRELEAFAYSVSHDLRAPLRAIDGFSRILQRDCASTLSTTGCEHLQRVRAASQHMGQLIDDLLQLSRTARAELRRVPVDLSRLAESIFAELRHAEPARCAVCVVSPDLVVNADPVLMRAVMENLLGNAWKFTGRVAQAHIEFGAARRDGERAFFVRDNGAGFDMAYADRLFGAFQRLHSTADFPGSGVGLATVQRIVHRHGGRLWAEAKVGAGATFSFTLPD